MEVLENNYEKICTEGEEKPKENDSSCTIINEQSSHRSPFLCSNQSKIFLNKIHIKLPVSLRYPIFTKNLV